MTEENKSKKSGYWDNNTFNEALIKHKIACQYAEENDLDEPRLPEYIGKCFIDLAYAIANRPNFRNYCVDDSTEALTKQGWKKYNEITLDDAILSYTNGNLTWSKILDIHISEYDGNMFHLKNQGMDAFITPGHKMITLEDGLKKVEHIRASDHIILNGNPIHQVQNEEYSDNFVKFVGWAVTEGHYSQGVRAKNLSISQNIGKKADQIRDILIELNIPFREKYYPEKSKIISFEMKDSYYVRELHKIAEKRVLSSEFILKLTHDQRLLLIKTMTDGDGWSRPNGGLSYVQKDKNHVDQFLFLCTISGLTTYTKKVENFISFGKETEFYVINIYKNPKKQCKSESTNWNGGFNSSHGGDVRSKNKISVKEKYPNTANIPYKGIVWCPKTEYGSFMCRRNGYIFLTGNTYLDDMVSDGIERCLAGWRNCDPNINKNSYGYFTVAVWFAFLQRIAKGNLEHSRKMNYINSIDPAILYEHGQDSHDEIEAYINQMKLELHDQMKYEPVQDIPRKKRAKKASSNYDVYEECFGHFEG